ncbi:MAG: 1-acyl-sn-glycerol-3-phosphate acyltransferase, partial [Thermodesulfobacteriota bacterium]|nr:1-acyl-sn-glycerol-3-phosphate acyltransferase [Thermodesulfobacteriota bacterium]
MSKRVRHVIYGIIIFCFYCAGRLMMRQRPKLKGKEHLEDIPLPIIFTVTHDSYFEIPSLSKIYQALKPKPIFSIMAKKDFLNGNYLSSNFRAKSPFIRSVCKIIDKSGIPKSLFKMMNMATVHRPFIETTMKKKDAFKRELSNQITHFKDTVSQGMSTLIFPEGTTWGFGGLKKIRSAAYQLVSNTFREYGKKVYVLPINVKVDRLVQGYKDVFINVGNPEFILKSKEDFNQYVRNSLLKLHTITFSQLGAYYLKKASILSIQTKKGITLTRENLTVQAERIVKEVNSRVQNKTLPAFDVRLVDKKYLSKKINRFIKYCTRNNYLIETK